MKCRFFLYTVIKDLKMKRVNCQNGLCCMFYLLRRKTSPYGKIWNIFGPLNRCRMTILSFINIIIIGLFNLVMIAVELLNGGVNRRMMSV